MYRQTEDLPASAPAKTGRYHELAEAIRRGAKRGAGRIRPLGSGN